MVSLIGYIRVTNVDIYRKDGKPYRIYTCNKCRYLQKIERLNKLTDRIEIILDRRYKPIKSERILDKGLISHIDLVAEDEIFVRLMDYKDVWISNYGRAIHLYADGEYKLIRQKITMIKHIVDTEIYLIKQ